MIRIIRSRFWLRLVVESRKLIKRGLCIEQHQFKRADVHVSNRLPRKPRIILYTIKLHTNR